MIIKNAKVFNENNIFVEKDVYIQGEFISDSCDTSIQTSTIEEKDVLEFDASDCYVIPGLTDLHVHGCVGFDFCDGTDEATAAIARYEARQGVTSIAPATMTLPEETLAQICKNASTFACDDGAMLCGINMEGPFLCTLKKGAQNALYLKKPDIPMYRRLNKLSGNMIKLVAIAPEEEGAMDFIKECKDETVISIAHTMADYDIAMEAFKNGATHVTHLYNAMLPHSHRAPGVVGAAMDSDCRVELITDGIHVHPSIVRTTFKMFGDDKIILVSDSMMATGMPDGQYSLGGQAVTVIGNTARLEDGTIAGSATNLMDCLRTAVSFGVSLESAVKCAAVNPAKEIGIFDKVGSIEAGKYANLVVLDKDLKLKAVFLKGQILK